VKVLVVDDERLARVRLMRMLERMPGIEIVGEADRGSTALVLVESLKPDLLMLDLEMPGLDGIAVAQKQGLPPIIFTTAHPGYAVQAFELDAVDYLMKPVRQDRLEQALEKVKRRHTAPSVEKLVVHDRGTTLLVDPLEVELFRASEKYTEFTHEQRELLVRESLDTLEERLTAVGFIRVHRSGLVRKDAIVGLEHQGEVLVARLSSGATVEVSRRRAAELRRLLTRK
jgi:DNA-binding LytR/AlgR family response regulator